MKDQHGPTVGFRTIGKCYTIFVFSFFRSEGRFRPETSLLFGELVETFRPETLPDGAPSLRACNYSVGRHLYIVCLGKTAENDGGTFRLKIPEGGVLAGEVFSLREFCALSVSPFRGEVYSIPYVCS